jgi:2-desacetyl-2-hydroxyethyl bacteriochlorophyllide A dehydrogenase
MKQAIMVAPGEIQIRQVSAPSAQAGEVLLRIRRIGVCGSDIHVYHGKHPYTSYPVVQGHEFSATVESVAEGATGIGPGMKVTAMPQITCGRCPPCRRGDWHICDKLRVWGFQAPGVAQELFAAPASSIVPLPETFSLEQGALVEPAAVAAHAVSRAPNLTGRNVAVLGAGPIGNLVAQAARAQGAGVLITDLSEHRLEIARRCGLTQTSNPATETLDAAAGRFFGDAGFQCAFECVGVEATIAAAIQAIRKGGTIVVVGVFGQKPRVDLGLVQDRELNVRGTLMYRRDDYERAIELIASGAIATAPLESMHFPLERYKAAYEFIDAQRDKIMKVFIDL